MKVSTLTFKILHNIQLQGKSSMQFKLSVKLNTISDFKHTYFQGRWTQFISYCQHKT